MCDVSHAIVLGVSVSCSKRVMQNDVDLAIRRDGFVEVAEENTLPYILSQQSYVALKFVWILLICFGGNRFKT